MLALRRILPELAKFGVVGLLGFVVDVGGFNLLRYAGPGGEGPLHHYVLTAKVVSSAASIVASWLGHRYWTYSHARRPEVHHEFFWFLTFSIIGTGLATGCLWFSHYVLDLRSVLADNISANGIGLVIATAFRWWSYRTFVFSGTPTDDAEQRQLISDPA